MKKETVKKRVHEEKDIEGHRWKTDKKWRQEKIIKTGDGKKKEDNREGWWEKDKLRK